MTPGAVDGPLGGGSLPLLLSLSDGAGKGVELALGGADTTRPARRWTWTVSRHRPGCLLAGLGSVLSAVGYASRR